MNMQKLSVLVNYVINQYIDILQAKTRKICKILSKKTGIGEREIYKETQRWGKREQKLAFQPPKSHSFSHQCLSLFLSLPPCLSLSLSLSFSPLLVFLSFCTPFSLSPTLFLSLSTPFSHCLLSLSATSISLSICPTLLSVSLYQFVSFSILFFNCVMQKKSGICKRVNFNPL